MKKNILKVLICICLVGFVWSCNTENDVQMQPDNSSAQQKSSSVWDGDLGVQLEDGTYSITADINELTNEVERLSALDGDVVKITSVEILKVKAVNDLSLEGVVLFAGTGNVGSGSKTMAFQLTQDIAGGVSLLDPFNGENTSGPKRISCRGCGHGCFIEYYKIDGHLVGYCLPAGCGVDCEKILR